VLFTLNRGGAVKRSLDGSAGLCDFEDHKIVETALFSAQVVKVFLLMVLAAMVENL